MSITKRGDRYVAKYKHLTAIASDRKAVIGVMAKLISGGLYG